MKYLFLGLLLVGCCDSSTRDSKETSPMTHINKRFDKFVDGNVTCYVDRYAHAVSCTRNQ